MKRQQGFSLLELLVAFSIMAFSLAMLYQMMGSSMRNVADAEQYQHAVVLAESLLTSKEFVDETGWGESGQSANFTWTVSSTPFPTAVSSASLQAVPLHELKLTVAWQAGGQARQLEVSTLRPQRKSPIQGLNK